MWAQESWSRTDESEGETYICVFPLRRCISFGLPVRGADECSLGVNGLFNSSAYHVHGSGIVCGHSHRLSAAALFPDLTHSQRSRRHCRL